jgi:hypothetical protein
MNGRHFSIVIATSLVTSAPTFADDLKSPFTPRQLVHCMMKRGRTNSAESYRDAYKACKDQLESAQSGRATDDAMTAARLPEDPKR